MLDKYLLDELKRSWLRYDSLEIKTKRMNYVWQHHTNSHAPPFLPLTVVESSDLLRYLGIWSLPLAASSSSPAGHPSGHQTLDGPHPGVCQGPSSPFRSHCQYPHNLCVVSRNSLAPHWNLALTGRLVSRDGLTHTGLLAIPQAFLFLYSFTHNASSARNLPLPPIPVESAYLTCKA